MTTAAEQESEKVINEEFKIWKKNSPFLYDLIVTHAFDWPSLTIQFLPDVTVAGESNIHRLITGTHTSGEEQNYLNILTCALPNANSALDSRALDEQAGEVSTYSNKAKLNKAQWINHEGEINRARYMPQNPCLISTCSVSTDVYIFDYTKHPSKPTDNTFRPNLRLKGLSGEVYGMAWNNLTKGHIIGSCEDGAICHWDLETYTKDGNEVDPVHTYRSDTIVGDVAYHSLHDSIFGSVCDDSTLTLWDTRTKSKNFSVKAHDGQANCLHFNPFSEYILATGGEDCVVNLWDIRNPQKCLHSLTGHRGEILRVLWSPHNETVIGSASGDRRLNIYDLSRIGAEFSDEEMQDGPPELLFVHGGHTSQVGDFDWDKNEPWLLSSAADDNVVMVWQMSQGIYANENDLDVSHDMVE